MTFFYLFGEPISFVHFLENHRKIDTKTVSNQSAMPVSQSIFFVRHRRLTLSWKECGEPHRQRYQRRVVRARPLPRE